MTGIDLIAAERERQTKLWGDEHDDGHVAGDLTDAAICYAQVALTNVKPTSMLAAAPMPTAPASWPWPDWWNPNWSDPVRALVKAGALIAAEIDRLQRSAPKPPPDPERLAAIAACPTPVYHQTHRYCPSCPWTEDDGVPTS